MLTVLPLAAVLVHQHKRKAQLDIRSLKAAQISLVKPSDPSTEVEYIGIEHVSNPL